jgi:Sulfotransferase family
VNGRRVPDFFIVGHAKSGTSALYRMLRRQPQIFMPDVKEPCFFVPEIAGTVSSSEKHPDTLDGYLALFAGARSDQLIGEATPSYLWSRSAAANIASVAPGARIIAILREPASFLRSLHLQYVRTHVEGEHDLRRAIALEQRRRRGEAIPRNSSRPEWLLYSEHVAYVEQLRRYRAVFPAEQILVLIYDDFRADNVGTIRRLLRFLELDDAAPIDLIEWNPSVRIRYPRAYALVRSLYLGSGPATRTAKAGIKALTPRRTRRRLIAAQLRAQRGAPRPPDEQLMRELRRRFKGEVVALSEYLGRDLVTLWGYDRID